MSTKHTPGPWEIDRLTSQWQICNRQRYAVAFVARNDAMPEDEQRANAHFIAAAPDLLAACEVISEETDFIKDDNARQLIKRLNRIREWANAAITKAKGDA